MIKNQLWINKLINFLGFLFLIIGLYALIRTSYNFYFLKDKYPTSSIFSLFPSYPSSVEDCEQQYTYPLYDEKGKLRSPSPYEEKERKKQVKLCLKQLKKMSQDAFEKDLWTTLFFLFLGSGILITKRFYL